MIRLVIADDHPVVREGLKYVVSQNRDMQLVGEAEDARSTLEICRSTRVDVLLLDVSMPGTGVVDLIRSLRAVRPSPRILVLSVHPERHYARRVLQADADGYLPKTHSPTALAEAIRQVYAGRKYVTPALAEELAVDLSAGRHATPHEALSNREYEVFRRLGAGSRVNEIALELGLSDKTVRTYRSRILEKMNLGSTAEIIFYAVQNGLVVPAPSRDVGEPGTPPEPLLHQGGREAKSGSRRRAATPSLAAAERRVSRRRA
jgi:two-component system, NarL family, invasion response regulator UvrY